jgi:hypothetical protein
MGLGPKESLRQGRDVGIIPRGEEESPEGDGSVEKAAEVVAGETGFLQDRREGAGREIAAAMDRHSDRLAGLAVD